MNKFVPDDSVKTRGKKSEKAVFGFQLMDAGNGQVYIKWECTMHRKTLMYWLRFGTTTLISVLIALNVPDLGHMLHQLLI